jgi:hypothetical protein
MIVSIFVEGIADKKFIEDFFRYLDPSKTITGIVVVDGYTNLYKYEPKISYTNDVGGRNYIIFDTDEDRGEKIFEINRIENKLKCSIEFFFLPNDKDSGNLEDLLQQMINPKHQIILDCFNGYQTCLGKAGGYTLPNKKALIYAYCEAILKKKDSKKIKEKNRDYLDKELWDIESEYLNPLKKFLKEIFDFNNT